MCLLFGRIPSHFRAVRRRRHRIHAARKQQHGYVAASRARRNRRASCPRGHTPHTAIVCARETRVGRPASARSSVARLDARHVLRAGDGEVQRGVDLLGVALLDDAGFAANSGPKSPRRASDSISGNSAGSLRRVGQRLQRAQHDVERHVLASRLRPCADRRCRCRGRPGPAGVLDRARASRPTSGCAFAAAVDAAHASRIASSAASRVRHTSSVMIMPGRRDAVERHGAHAIRMPAQVLLRDARAVAAAPQVPARVAERLAHRFEVGDPRRGRVLRGVDALAPQARRRTRARAAPDRCRTVRRRAA